MQRDRSIGSRGEGGARMSHYCTARRMHEPHHAVDSPPTRWDVGVCDSKQENYLRLFLGPRGWLLVGWEGVHVHMLYVDVAGDGRLRKWKCRGMRRCRSVGLLEVLAFT
jgi:hypothetical protein